MHNVGDDGKVLLSMYLKDLPDEAYAAVCDVPHVREASKVLRLEAGFSL